MRILGAFLHLLGAGTRNAVVARARRIRDPRYAVALGVGLLYFGWLIGGVWLDIAQEPPGLGRELELAAPLFLAALVAWWWLRGGFESALAFSPAEVHLLFPAPLTRRDLLHLKLLRSLGTIVLTALLGAVFLRAGRLSFGLDFLSFLVLVTTLHLHQLASSLVRAGGVRHGRAGLRRMWVPLVLLGLAAVALGWSFWSALDALRVATDLEAATGAVASALREPVPRAVLLPFRWVLGPTLASDGGEWLRALPPAAALLVVHYLWVVRSDAAFEEAAAEAGRRRLDRKRSLRAGRFRLGVRPSTRVGATPLPLAAVGPVWSAMVWKNATGILRDYPVRLLLPAVPLGVVALGLVFAWFSGTPAAGVDVAVLLVIVLLVLLVLFGPIAFRRDLRADLEHLEVLRTFPLPSRSFAAGELVSSTLFLSAVSGLLLGGGLLLLPWSGDFRFLLPWALPTAVTALLLLLPVTALLLAAQNLLTLLLPGWARIGKGGGDGVEFIGRQIVTLLLALLMDAVVLVPAIVVGGAAGVGLLHLFGPWALLAGGTVAWLAVVAEVALAVVALAALWERVDPLEAGVL